MKKLILTIGILCVVCAVFLPIIPAMAKDVIIEGALRDIRFFSNGSAQIVIDGNYVKNDIFIACQANRYIWRQDNLYRIELAWLPTNHFLTILSVQIRSKVNGKEKWIPKASMNAVDK